MSKDKLNPEVKAWFDNVIVPALVREWIKRHSTRSEPAPESLQADRDAEGETVPTRLKQPGTKSVSYSSKDITVEKSEGTVQVNNSKSDWKTKQFFRMRPRVLFHMDDGKKVLNETLSGPGVYVLYRDDDPYYIGKTMEPYSTQSGSIALTTIAPARPPITNPTGPASAASEIAPMLTRPQVFSSVLFTLNFGNRSTGSTVPCSRARQSATLRSGCAEVCPRIACPRRQRGQANTHCDPKVQRMGLAA